jgi:hypothetical protein
LDCIQRILVRFFAVVAHFLPSWRIASGKRSQRGIKAAIMQRPNELPTEARRAAWDALWKRLLSDPPRDPEPAETEEHEDDEAA